MKKIFFRFFLTIVALSASVLIADAQEAIFLVRHAEQAGPGSTNPPLTEPGERRAKRLADVLKDAGIDVIFVSEESCCTKRTAQTAEPLEKALNVKVKLIPRKDYDGLIARLHTEHAHDSVLIVGHRSTVPKWVNAFGYPVKVKIAPLEYDNLFVIVPKSGGEPLVLRLRY